jgi:hypothetical protein
VVLGAIGMGLFAYGKKQQRFPQLVAGLLLMIYPSFVSTIGQMMGVGVLLFAALWWALWMGW